MSMHPPLPAFSHAKATSTAGPHWVRNISTSLVKTVSRAGTAKTSRDAEELFANLREYARQQQLSVLELIAGYALDDLPLSIAQMIREYLAERSPKVEPGQVEYRSFFASGRPDISERMAEIIYGPEPSEYE